MNPTALKLCGGIHSEGSLLHPLQIESRQQTGAHKHLKTVADTNHQTSRFDISGKRIGELVTHFVSQQDASGDVIAVRETARDRYNLIIYEVNLTGNQLVDVNQRCLPAHKLKGVICFIIAVRACGAKDKNLRFHLDLPPILKSRDFTTETSPANSP